MERLGGHIQGCGVSHARACQLQLSLAHTVLRSNNILIRFSKGAYHPIHGLTPVRITHTVGLLRHDAAEGVYHSLAGLFKNLIDRPFKIGKTTVKHLFTDGNLHVITIIFLFNLVYRARVQRLLHAQASFLGGFQCILRVLKSASRAADVRQFNILLRIRQLELRVAHRILQRVDVRVKQFIQRLLLIAQRVPRRGNPLLCRSYLGSAGILKVAQDVPGIGHRLLRIGHI